MLDNTNNAKLLSQKSETGQKSAARIPRERNFDSRKKNCFFLPEESILELEDFSYRGPA